MRNIFYKSKYLLDTLIENEIDLYKAEYEEDIIPIMDMMFDNGFVGQSIQTYVSVWRQFFLFLDSQDIPHAMDFPPLSEFDDSEHKEQDQYSHAKNRTLTKHYDPAVNKTWFTSRPTFAEDVLTMAEFWEFYNALEKYDSVYSVIALVMLQTLLRSGGIIQFPKISNRLNPTWKSYTKLKEAGLEYQDLKFINKGQKQATCMVTLHTMEIIQKKYLDESYDERKLLYVQKYLKTKHAINKGITNIFEHNPLWLNKNGTPVSQYMIQKVFREISKNLGKRIYPHMLRHTGATHLLLNFEKATGTELMLSMTADIHCWLQLQLCHKQFETTEKYIKTIKKIRGNAAVLALLPGQLKEMESFIPGDVMQVYNMHMNAHHKSLTSLAKAS
jgi:site-specific recombinase XerC